MKTILVIAGMTIVAALGAAAQDEDQKIVMDKLKLELARTAKLTAEAGVMRQPVMGAPFSGTEVSESAQTLADGTKIHNEHQTQVYRDGAGRTRREMGNTIVIMDPVAKVRYSIDTEHKTAIAMPMNFVKIQAGGRGGIGGNDQFVTYSVSQGYAATSGVFVKDGQDMQVKVIKKEARANTEDLGPQAMEGVVAQGTRTTRTIEAGEIGNDRPINITSERWYSEQLQTIMMTRQNDPRSGENIFKLTNVKLGEPDAGLFQVPAGYQVTERK
ncbi:MAG TPA: hypothetical protein VLW65_09560 [Bryobacteraceae bacterium]|nr:hypothetical protein [Bryobacteraceae bacterium]